MSWNFGAGITCTARVDMTGMNMYDAYLVWIEHTIEATGQDKFLQSVKNYGVDYVVNSLLTTFFNQWRPVGSGFSGGVTEEQIIELIRSRVEEFAASIPKPPVGSKTTSAMHRRPNMAWNFDTNKSAAMATLQRLATKGTDPLDDDIKAIADRAAQDAATVVSNLANERALADMYHKSDKSKGLDKGSEFYNTIQKYSEENFKRSKPQLDAILQKYQEKDELA